ncbi:MAG: DUF488 domain-containing protein [Acidobacteriaceae bacterium]
MIELERAYNLHGKRGGTRFLVERLWPRGVKKTSLHIKEWLKDVAPSTELRKWFSHDPAKWDEFRRRYFAELESNPGGWKPIVDAGKKGAVTLIYSSHDTEHNNAVALAEFLKRHALKKKARKSAA